MMDRRAFIAGTGAILLPAPRTAEAQADQKRPRIAVLWNNTPVANMMGPQPASDDFKAFLDGMRALGWRDGENITIERRSAEGHPERRAGLVKELVELRVDVVMVSSLSVVKMIKQASPTMPIVIGGQTGSADGLIREGLIASLARPGGSVTGLVGSPGREIDDKRLQLLKEAIPKVARVAWLSEPAYNAARPTEAPRALKLTLVPVGAAAPEALDSAFAAIGRQRVDAILLGPGTFFYGHRLRIIDFAARQRLPVMYWEPTFTESGGLMSYGPDWSDAIRRVPTYVDRILKGAKPGDLPMEQPTKFELVINLKTAKAIGLTIPPSLLGRADEVIQ
ncbi:MAG: ABC transporter substrate-binding protein [Gemmatimonadales bacterium]